MLELPENLLPKFEKKIRGLISINEITMVRIQLSPKTAIVLTNRAFYFLEKKWLRIECAQYSREDIKGLYFENGRLNVEFSKEKAKALALQVSKDKHGTLKHSLKEMQRLLPDVEIRGYL